MVGCTTCPHKGPQGLSQGPTPFFPRRCGLGKILSLFTKTFIHANLELKKVPALNTLGKISVKPKSKRTKENSLQLANIPTPCLHQKLFCIKPIISIGTESVRSLCAWTPVMLWLGSVDVGLSSLCWAPEQTAISAVAQTQQSVQIGMLRHQEICPWHLFGRFNNF